MGDTQAGQNHEKDKSLLEGEDKYRRLINQMLNGYARHEIICNDQGQPIDYRFLEVNPAFEIMTGFKAESVVGHTVLEILPQTESSWIENFGKVALTGKSNHFEKFNQQLNRYYDIAAFCTAPNQFACFFTDITERKQAEEALLESESRFRNVIERSPFGTHFYELQSDDSLLFINANPAADTILGVANNQFIGKTIEEAFPGLADSEVPGQYRSLASNGGTWYTDQIIYDGETIQGAYSVTAFQIRPGEMVAMFIDITARKQAEFALAAEKERLAVTLRSIGDGVITTDMNGNITMLNKAAEELTGWDSAEAIGRPLPEVFNIVNELTRQQGGNPFERVLANGGIVELENHSCLRAKDGREIVIADSGAPIHDNESRIVGVVLVFRDLTEKQELEDFMRKSQKLESLGVLAGGIAHDFNNILGGIFGYIEMAIEETTEEGVSSCLAESLSNIDRARALTQQLLTFSKGGAPIKKVENLFPFVQKTAQFALSGSSVSSSFRIQENLWPCDFDKNQIGQVLDNLIINAQQAMPNGGTIEVSARNISLPEKEHISLAAGNYVKLSIKDQGIGIPKEFLGSIFDPYYTTKSKGHGLGLSTCYSIVTRHDGCLDVESDPGKGSTFHVYLPASSESISTIARRSPSKHSGSGTFMVMDDEESIRMLLKRMLESFGYTVVLTKNGKDAIDFFVTEIKANRKFTGMIFDLTIPGGLGGKEAIREIRKTCSKTPVFVASGYSGDSIMANPEKYGFNASIGKPFKKVELSEMLEKHLKKPITFPSVTSGSFQAES